MRLAKIFKGDLNRQQKTKISWLVTTIEKIFKYQFRNRTNHFFHLREQTMQRLGIANYLLHLTEAWEQQSRRKN